VLGADQAGETALLYAWQVVSAPSSATPSFSTNGSNTAKKTKVTFNRAGTYIFEVTITDPNGLTATSFLNLKVNPTLSAIDVTPSLVTLAHRAREQFSALAADQFGQPLAIQPAFRWSKSSGRGLLKRNGFYSAPARGRGIAVIEASASGKSGRAFVDIVAPTAAGLQKTIRTPRHQNSIA
jgi:hypothetical protein